MRTIRALVLALLMSAATACVLDSGPQVACLDLSAADCNRAVEMARPLFGESWWEASGVDVGPGNCAPGFGCPNAPAAQLAFITVQLRGDLERATFVTIDRREDEWTASCSIVVQSDVEAHTEPCPSP